MDKNPQDFVPLTPLSFNILLTMADGPQHGYALIREIEDRTEGLIRPTAGGTYLALNRLLEQKLIEESPEGDTVRHQGPSRRIYRLTSLGRDVIKVEARRIASELGAAIDKRVVDPSILKS